MFNLVYFISYFLVVGCSHLSSLYFIIWHLFLLLFAPLPNSDYMISNLWPISYFLAWWILHLLEILFWNHNCRLLLHFHLKVVQLYDLFLCFQKCNHLCYFLQMDLNFYKTLEPRIQSLIHYSDFEFIDPLFINRQKAEFDKILHPKN